jgi:hypothetical protein
MLAVNQNGDAIPARAAEHFDEACRAARMRVSHPMIGEVEVPASPSEWSLDMFKAHPAVSFHLDVFTQTLDELRKMLLPEAMHASLVADMLRAELEGAPVEIQFRVMESTRGRYSVHVAPLHEREWSALRKAIKAVEHQLPADLEIDIKVGHDLASHDHGPTVALTFAASVTKHEEDVTVRFRWITTDELVEVNRRLACTGQRSLANRTLVTVDVYPHLIVAEGPGLAEVIPERLLRDAAERAARELNKRAWDEPHRWASSLLSLKGVDLERAAENFGLPLRRAPASADRPWVVQRIATEKGDVDVRFWPATEGDRRALARTSMHMVRLDDGRFVIDSRAGLVVAGRECAMVPMGRAHEAAEEAAIRLLSLVDPMRPNTGSPDFIYTWICDALAGRGVRFDAPMGFEVSRRDSVMTLVVRGWISAKVGEAIADVVARARQEVMPAGIYLDLRYPDMDSADRLAARLRDALAAADFGPPSVVAVAPSGHKFAAHAGVYVPPVRRTAFEEAVEKVCKERGIDRAALSLTTANIPQRTDDRAQIVGLLWDHPDEATHIHDYHVVVTKAGPRADVSLASGRRLSFVADTQTMAGAVFRSDGADVLIVEDSGRRPEDAVSAIEAAARLAVRVLGLEPQKAPPPQHVALLPEQVRARRQQNVINGRAFLDDSVHACAGDARDLLLEFGQKKGARWERLRVEVANLVEVANTRPVPLPVSFWMLREIAWLVADEDAAPSGPRPSPHRRLLDEAMCDARAA